MNPQTQLVPGYFVWESPRSPVVVYLSIGTLDRLEAEVLRGFGAIPKRGAEVGGVLLGAVEHIPENGHSTVVRIRDFEPVGCSYRRGPIYSLDDGESRRFAETCEHWKAGAARPVAAVGFYRSNTRAAPGLAEADLALLDAHFPESEAIALLVRPFATKASVGGFFVREDGAFPAASPLEFPFRRRELTGEEPSSRRAASEGRGSKAPASFDETRIASNHAALSPPAQESAPSAESHPRRGLASKLSASWVWMALSFILLLLGLFLGFQLAMGLGPRRAAAAADDEFSLGLTVTRAEDNLNVRWNRDAPAIRSGQKGLLEIEEAGYSKPVDLDQAHLQNGSIIYRHGSGRVHFRLIVYVNPRLTVTETLEWRQ